MDKIYLELDRIKSSIIKKTNQTHVTINAKMWGAYLYIECHWRIEDLHYKQAYTYEEVCHLMEKATDSFITKASDTYEKGTEGYG